MKTLIAGVTVAMFVGCTPEDMGAKIKRECASVVAAAIEAEDVSPAMSAAIDAELRVRGVTVPVYPDSALDKEVEWQKLLAAAKDKKEQEARAARLEAYRAEWAKLRETDTYRAAYKAAEDREREKRVDKCVSQRARAFEGGSRPKTDAR
jgi:hypothetical protein